MDEETKVKKVRLGKPIKMSERTMLGVSLIMNNGMSATCIEDNGYTDIVVRFEDGTIVKASRQRFRQKSIANPSLGKNKTYIQ